IIASRDELDYTRSDLENIKTKLQNVVDRGSNQKTDELLAQILQIFLADLGLQIQNKELLLQKAKQASIVATPPAPASGGEVKLEPAIETKNETPEEKPKKNQDWKKVTDLRYQQLEESLLDSKSDKDILRILKNLKITRLEKFLNLSEEAQASFFESFNGTYVGAIFDINSKHYGSLSYKSNVIKTEASERVAGEINFSSVDHGKSSRTFDEKSFGRVVYGFRSVIIHHSDNKYFQFYRLKNVNKIAGNYYEKLPNGTTNLIGIFTLNRVDQF
ncbi:MAG: hypothetical protein K2P92_08850, partial [Bdellovibrionaceae bacterium]|nr:hypothetical protein [Pseudobdellovibrionaceae bacterium]